jgi:hypothetical protein
MTSWYIRFAFPNTWKPNIASDTLCKQSIGKGDILTPHEATGEGVLMRLQHRERMLRSSIERVRKHPAKKEYRKELQKRGEALRKTTLFLQELANEENSKGLSSNNQRSKSELTKVANDVEGSSKEIAEAIRMLQKRTKGRSADERIRAVFRRRHEQGYCTAWN